MRLKRQSIYCYVAHGGQQLFFFGPKQVSTQEMFSYKILRSHQTGQLFQDTSCAVAEQESEAVRQHCMPRSPPSGYLVPHIDAHVLPCLLLCSIYVEQQKFNDGAACWLGSNQEFGLSNELAVSKIFHCTVCTYGKLTASSATFLPPTYTPTYCIHCYRLELGTMYIGTYSS